MKNNFSENDIEDAMKSIEANPSKEWQENTLKVLKNISQKENVTNGNNFRIHNRESFFSPLFSFLKSIIMKKALSFIAIFAIVFGVVWNYNIPVSVAKRHLNNANEALAQLQAYTRGESFALIKTDDLLVSSAYAEEGETAVIDEVNVIDSEPTDEVVETPIVLEGIEVTEEVAPANEKIVQELIETVGEETELAIEATEEIGDAETTIVVLELVDETQDETVETLSEVILTAEDDDTLALAEEVIEDTVEENEQVEESIDEAEVVVEEGGDEVVVDVVTDTDQESTDEVAVEDEDVPSEEGNYEAKLGKAKEFMEGLNLEEVELSPSMQKKYDAVQEILAQCESGEGKCQAGKAKGLTTALSAKLRNETRKQVREEENNNKGKKIDEDTEDASEEETESAEDEVGAEEDNTVVGVGIEADDDEIIVESSENSEKENAVKENSNGNSKGNSNKKNFEDISDEEVVGPPTTEVEDEVEAIDSEDEGNVEPVVSSPESESKGNSSNSNKGGKNK